MAPDADSKSEHHSLYSTAVSIDALCAGAEQVVCSKCE